MNISTALFQELVAFLTPLPCFENERARKTLLLYSGLSELLPRIECDGKPKEFVTLAIDQLAKYCDIAGEPALLMLLRGVAKEVGTDKQAMLQDFEERLKSEQPPRRIFPPKDTPPHPTLPARSFSRASVSMFGLMVLLMIAVAAGYWRFWPDIEPFLKKTPTPTQPTPRPSEEGNTVELPSSERPGVGSCWENETAGATCKEDTTGMEFVYVPGGCFQMGSPESEDGRYDNEGPVHEVCLKGFWMGKFEVTQAQWQAVMNTNPSYFKGANRPIESITWNDAQDFLKKLSGGNAAFRLPSEAEWEYACRAGTTMPFYFGETISTDQANYDGDYTYGNGKKGQYRQQTTDVGSFPPNDFGLYDMHGNVWEWVADTYHDNYNGAPTDGSAWNSGGSVRVLRGGSWGSGPRSVRSAVRSDVGPAYRSDFIGFRVARTK